MTNYPDEVHWDGSILNYGDGDDDQAPEPYPMACEWRKHRAEFTIPEGKTSASFRLGGYSDGAPMDAMVWLDDFTLTEMTALVLEAS